MMSELKWNWAYYPYLDPPEKQKESALKAGYIKVVNKDDADKVIAHNKYKRCLDLIEIAKLQRSKLMPKHAWWEVERARIKDERIKKLLELAEKFKEVK